MRKATPGPSADADAALAQLVRSPSVLPSLHAPIRPVLRRHRAAISARSRTGRQHPNSKHALFALEPGTIAPEPVATRYGFHIIRLDRRIEGRQLPFDLVAERIADYLRENVERRAIAQYVARLASRATIDGVTLRSAEALRVH